MNITYEESNWSRIVRYISLLIMLVFGTLIGCETLRTPRVTDLRVDSPVVVEAIVKEERGLDGLDFLNMIREACRFKGGFQVNYEGTIEHYRCYPIKEYGDE